MLKLGCQIKAKKLELARCLHWLACYTQPVFEALYHTCAQPRGALFVFMGRDSGLLRWLYCDTLPVPRCMSAWCLLVTLQASLALL